MVFVNRGYTGKLIAWKLKVIKQTESHRFAVLPKRWIETFPNKSVEFVVNHPSVRDLLWETI